ncbi:unnamed protein product [Arabidopsis arenosa]|uniref:Uncharacterized protein n=1 Tax=Arabidopsis arenosa TaxID=38785 RepID=A0A8S2AYE0_ARAAE|nr:unnamed protein product [Arabidopsis arenosa]
MESMALDPELDMDDEDLETMESDVKQMAKKISEYRQTLPDHLRNTLDSALSSHIDSGSDPLPSPCLTIAGRVKYESNGLCIEFMMNQQHSLQLVKVLAKS